MQANSIMASLSIQVLENHQFDDHSTPRVDDANRDGVDATPSTNMMSPGRPTRGDVSRIPMMLNRSSPFNDRSTDSPSLKTPRSISIKPQLQEISGCPDSVILLKNVVIYNGSSDTTSLYSPKSEPNSPSSQSQGGRILSLGSKRGSSYETEDSLTEKQVKLPSRVRKMPATSTPKTSIDEYKNECISSKAMNEASFEVPQSNEIEISKSIDEMVIGIGQMIDADFETLFQRKWEELLEGIQRWNKVSSPATSSDEHSNLDKTIEEVVAELEEVMENSIAQLDEEPEECVEDILNVTSKSTDASKDFDLMSAPTREEVRGMIFHTALKNEGGVELSIQTNLSTESSLTTNIRPKMGYFEYHDEIGASNFDWDMSQSSIATEGRVTRRNLRGRLPYEPYVSKGAIHGVSGGEERSAGSLKDCSRTRHHNLQQSYYSRGDSQSTSSTGKCDWKEKTPVRGNRTGKRPSPPQKLRPSPLTTLHIGHRKPLTTVRRSRHVPLPSGSCGRQASPSASSSSIRPSPSMNSHYSRGHLSVRTHDHSAATSKQIMLSLVKSSSCSKLGRQSSARKFNFGSKSDKSGESRSERALISSNSSRSASDRESLRHSIPSLVDILSPSPVGCDRDCTKDMNSTLRAKPGKTFNFNHDHIDDTSLSLKIQNGPGDNAPQDYGKYLVGGGEGASGELEVTPSDSYLPDVETSNSANTVIRMNPAADYVSSGRARPLRPPKLQMEVFGVDSSESREGTALALDSFRSFEKVTELKVDKTKLLFDSAIDEVASLQQMLEKQNKELAKQKVLLEHQAHSISLLKTERDLLQSGMVGYRYKGSKNQATNASSLFDQLFTSCSTWSQKLSQQLSQNFVCAAY